MNKSKKARISLVIILFLGIVIAAVVVGPKYYYNRQAQVIDFLVSQNLGALQDKVTVEERQKLGCLTSVENYLKGKRIENNELEPDFLEAYFTSCINKRLNDYTIKYLLEGYEYENEGRVEEVENQNSDKLLKKLKTVLEENDFIKLTELVANYHKGSLESGYEIEEILDQYNTLEVETILSYLTDNSTLDLKARFNINPDKTITYDYIAPIIPQNLSDEEMKKYETIWSEVKRILPSNALEPFEKVYYCTDGENNELASVQANNEEGSRWIMNIDPTDADLGKDKRLFYETIFHEYFHYVTLNDKEVDYTDEYNMERYCENGMVSHEDSYINAFYKAFWEPILSDRLIDKESLYFYDRHRKSFVDEYSATDPSEDIAESFSFFVLEDEPKGDSIRNQKIKFFYNYKELVELRNYIRQRITL